MSWSSYVQSLLHGRGLDLPHWLGPAPGAGGVFNLPAVCIIVAMSVLLMGGVSEPARINAVIVVVKVAIILVMVSLGAFYPVATAIDRTPFVWLQVTVKLGINGCGRLALGLLLYAAYGHRRAARVRRAA